MVWAFFPRPVAGRKNAAHFKHGKMPKDLPYHLMLSPMEMSNLLCMWCNHFSSILKLTQIELNTPQAELEGENAGQGLVLPL